MVLWFKIGQSIKNEADGRLYEPCLKQMHSLACDDGERTFLDWWNVFWSIVGMKIPDVACDYIAEFLSDIIDRQQLNMIGVLPVS